MIRSVKNLFKRQQEKAVLEVPEPTGFPTMGNEIPWQMRVPTQTGAITRNGSIFVFGFLAAFLIWAVAFPIASAVVSSGKIVSVGQNKLIQHPSGGVVQQILISDGSFVEKDQILLVLDPSNSQAELTRLEARHTMLSALKTRLEAETSGAAFGQTVSVSGLRLRGAQAIAPENGNAADSQVLREQEREFDAGRKRLNAELDAARHQMESLKDRRAGLQTRLNSARQLLDFTKMELKRTRPLVEDGYLAKSRMWDLDKKRLEQISQVGNLKSEINGMKQQVLEAEAKLSQLAAADTEKRSEELTTVITELAQIKDQLQAARSSLNLTELKAPQSGTVVKLAAHTLGGVVAPGEVIAEIVPQKAGLETEFRVGVSDVDNVSVGQSARIVVTAFNRRTYDPIDGVVTYVSADSALDEATGQTYFTARARMKQDPEKRQGLQEIHAGMATEVFALAEPRVFMNYALQPLYDSMHRSFREAN